MASRAIRMGMAPALPLNLIAQAVPMLTRHELAALTERLLEALDGIDGDPDLEPDDEDTTVDDQPCDEPWQDLEHHENAVPIFGVDQTKWTIGPHGYPACR